MISDALWFKLYVIFVVGFIVVGVGLRVLPVINYVEFYYDQARDAMVAQEALAGNWPTLGPSASVSSFSLPPQYYYLLLPLAALSNLPEAQLLVNTIATLAGLAVVYLMLRCWVLNDQSMAVRKWVSGIGVLLVGAGHWYYGLSIGAWNPNSLPLAMLVLTVAFYVLFGNVQLQVRGRVVPEWAWWVLAGLSAGVAMGLHSTALFVVPLWVAAVSGYWIYRRGSWTGPLIGMVVIGLVHIPYFYGELATNWVNSRQIIDYLLSDSSVSLWQRIVRSIEYNLVLMQAFIFPATQYLRVASLVAGGIGVVGMYALYRLDKRLLVLLAGPWLLFCLLGSGYQGAVHHHYILLGFWLPPLALLSLLVYGRRWGGQWAIGVVGMVVVGSLLLNSLFVVKTIKADFMAAHRVNIEEKRQVLEQLPDGARICSLYGQDLTDLVYIQRYMEVRPDVRLINDCGEAEYSIYLYDVPKRPALSGVFDNSLGTVVEAEVFLLQQLPAKE